MTPERIEEIKREIRMNNHRTYARIEMWEVNYLFNALEEAQKELTMERERTDYWGEKELEARRELAEAKQKIDKALSWTWDCSEANMLEVISALRGEA